MITNLPCEVRQLLSTALSVVLVAAFIMTSGSVSAQRPRSPSEPRRIERQNPSLYPRPLPRRGDGRAYPQWVSYSVGALVGLGALFVLAIYIRSVFTDPDARESFYGLCFLGIIVACIVGAFLYLPAWLAWMVFSLPFLVFIWFVAVYAPRAARQLENNHDDAKPVKSAE